jgi:hypothetical protein
LNTSSLQAVAAAAMDTTVIAPVFITFMSPAVVAAQAAIEQQQVLL